MNIRIILLLSVTFCFLISGNTQSQSTKKVELKKFKRIDKPAREEVSGIIKDTRFDGVLWVHGDSGTKNKVYPINFEGELLPNKDSKGLELDGIKNRDWEDISIDENGNLYIADVGNNCSCRTDQSIIFLNNPLAVTQHSEDYTVYKISYEKPDGFLYRFLNYSMDVEALFLKEGTVYAITKRFNGNSTKLFKLESLDKNKNNEFKLVQTNDFDDEVTAADYAFGKLAVLTYKSLWIFKDDETEDMFDGDITRYTFDAEQVESVTFLDSTTVLIAEENGELYKIKLN